MERAPKRRHSLFDQNAGSNSYSDKLHADLDHYNQILKAQFKDSFIEPSKLCNESIISMKSLPIEVPNLDYYVKTMDEFLKKHTIVQQQREQMKKRLANIQKLL